MIVARKTNKKEECLLKGNEHCSLIIRDLSGELIKSIKPDPLWTIEQLESFDYDELAPFGWNAHLDRHWIGSSEV